MESAFRWNDRYAGDDAWAEWFKICSVRGCSAAHSAALAAEVESAMYAHLHRHGISREDAQGEDPVAFFDSYFKLRGDRDGKKPLKSYYAYRIVAEGKSMQDFVCGTLFGSASGRIRDIVLEWISAMKGWRARTVSRPDGTRGLEWENAGFSPDDPADEASVEFDPAALLDETSYRASAAGAIARAAGRIRVCASSVALCVYATAMDISITEPAVLSALGLAKSRAYAVRDKALAALERELADVEGADDPVFARVLLETCARTVDAKTRAALGMAE